MTRSRLIAVTVLMVVATACGSGTEPSAIASLDSGNDPNESVGEVLVDEVDSEEAALAFTECLREEGLDVEDPTFDGVGGFVFDFRSLRPGGSEDPGSEDEFRAAVDLCIPLMEGATGFFDQADRTEMEDSLLAFSQCLRGEGIDVPDPDFGAGGSGGPGGGGLFGGAIDLDDPIAEAAFEKCQSELAFAGPGGGLGRPGGGNNGGDGS